MDPKESYPAGIPHPSPSPPGNHGDGKLGVGEVNKNLAQICGLWYKKSSRGTPLLFIFHRGGTQWLGNVKFAANDLT